MYMIRARDGGQRLRADLFQEAPPERPFVRHDKANVKHEIPVPAEDIGGKDTMPTAGGIPRHVPATIEAAELLTAMPDLKTP